jgi:hypothetical protein
LVAALAFFSGCETAPRPTPPFWLAALPFWQPPLPVKWGAPQLFVLKMGEPLDLSRVNLDQFFPRDVSTVLVSKEAFEAGLFRPAAYAVGDDAELVFSPDGNWIAQRRHVVSRGVTNDIIDVGRVGQPKRNAWAIGQFSGMHWSPENHAIAINETRADGTRRGFVFTLADWELTEIAVESTDLVSLLSAGDLAAPRTTVCKRWISRDYVLVWVHALPVGGDPVPRWGFEALVNVTGPGSANARVSRAWVRN